MPFHGIVPGKQAVPLGQINLLVTFRDLTNYRMETLTFEVVVFLEFMDVPNYTYLKLKMLSPCGHHHRHLLLARL